MGISFADEIVSLRRVWEEELAKIGEPQEPERGIFQQTQVLAFLNRRIAKDGVVVSAAGSLPGDLQRMWLAGSHGGYHLEYGYSCMGYEVAGGLGVKLANPEREVWVVVGDGSFLMLHSEIVTAIQEGVKINILVFDSRGFNCIRSLQRAHGSDGFATDLRYRSASGQLDGDFIPIDFSQYGRALGLATSRVSTFSELDMQIRAAQSEVRSTLIEVKVAQDSMSSGYDTWWRVDGVEGLAPPAPVGSAVFCASMKGG